MTSQVAIGQLDAWRIGLAEHWIEHAWDSGSGGWFEELGPDGPGGSSRKMLITQGRQLSVLARAFQDGAAGAEGAAERTVAFITDRFQREEGEFVSFFDPGAPGAPATVDAYEYAALLHGLACWHAVRPASGGLALANSAMAHLDRFMRDIVAGGWFETPDRRPPRRQNPHMHLLEAAHAWFSATGDAAWMQRADGIVQLFLSKFYDRHSRTIVEFFDHRLTPDPAPIDSHDRFHADRGSYYLRFGNTPASLIREPGHALEWTWLLAEHARLAGDESLLDLAAALHATAVSTGRSPLGPFVQATDPDGAPLEPRMLMWAQAEAVRAAIALVHRHGSDTPAHEWSLLVDRFLPDGGPLWRNELDPSGAPCASTSPTRSLYHLYGSAAGFADFRRRNDQGSSTGSPHHDTR